MAVIREFVEEDEVCYEYCKCINCRINRLEREILDIKLRTERSVISSDQ